MVGPACLWLRFRQSLLSKQFRLALHTAGYWLMLAHRDAVPLARAEFTLASKSKSFSTGDASFQSEVEGRVERAADHVTKACRSGRRGAKGRNNPDDG